jgi:hypothetical protein
MKISTKVSVQIIQRTIGAFFFIVIQKVFKLSVDGVPMSDIQSSVGGIRFDAYQVYIKKDHLHAVSKIDEYASGGFKLHFNAFTVGKGDYELTVRPGDTLDIAVPITKEPEE